MFGFSVALTRLQVCDICFQIARLVLWRVGVIRLLFRLAAMASAP